MSQCIIGYGKDLPVETKMHIRQLFVLNNELAHRDLDDIETNLYMNLVKQCWTQVLQINSRYIKLTDTGDIDEQSLNVYR